MNDRDQTIIDMTNRYRLGTNAAYRQLAFDGQSMNAVTKVTARLCRQGLLSRYPLVPPEDYFTLGPRSAKQLGVSPKRTEPLGPQALPIDYAVLLYATHGGRTRLISDELRQAATWMPEELTHAPHCRTSTGILELVRVDLGGSPLHVAKKAATDCSRRMEVPEFRQLVTSSRFQLVVLTTTSSKARLIRQAVESMQWQHDIRLHLAMIPRLTQLQLRSA